ncbi:MAG: adenosylcobinamide amidohydrolase [Anaerolineales bacterium]|nr:adenosylcobinamide amidohydrolase [Anaerolineales bacterium]
MKDRLIQPFPALQITINAQWVKLVTSSPWYALSSALLGCGFTEFCSLFIYHVHKNYDHPEPWRHLQELAVTERMPSPAIGLLTAASLERTQVISLGEGALQVCALVTAGVSNATSAGLTPPTVFVGANTINIVLLVNRALSPAAMVNAVITVTEAKTDTLNRLGIKTPQGEIASGTSTDTVVIAHNGEGEPFPYAGPATAVGWLMAKAVRLALSQALR